LVLLGVSALARAAGQLSAINILGALMLVADVYAIALLARLQHRARALSPGWLAVAFAFSMPLERMLQRSLGYGLQQISADGACRVLGTLYDSVRCEGIRIILDGRDVLVDLPCSGARTLLLSALAFSLASALLRPRLAEAGAGIATTLAAALVANIVRITVLAIGIAYPETLGGIDVMAKPWHDVIGYAALAVGLLTLVVWARLIHGRGGARSETCSRTVTTKRSPAFSGPGSGRFSILQRIGGIPHGGAVLGVVAVGIALAIVNLPRRAIDVAHVDAALAAPDWIMGMRAQPIPIADFEANYFTRFGGAAVKASYGPSNLMLVRTTSPLRHLHAPDECLRGLGFTVDYRGMSFEPLPTAHYIAAAPDGRRYRVDVSFASNRGHVTGSVAIAVWHWLKRDARQWTAIQRISPIELPLASHQAFSAAALFTLGYEPRASASAPDPAWPLPSLTTARSNSTKG
jgi:exosortase/archaeosortase family protein